MGKEVSVFYINSYNLIRCIRKAAERKGSLVTETVIVLPVFILSVLTLSCLIKAVWIQVSLFETLADEARRLSVSSCISESISAEEKSGLSGLLEGISPGAADRITFFHGVCSGLEERGIPSQETEMLSFQKEGTSGRNGLIRAELSYHLKIPLPAASVNEIQICNMICFRQWKGEDYSDGVFSFQRMGQAENGVPVYIFPDAGQRFHRGSCRYIDSGAERTVATELLLKEYSRCPLCLEEDALPGEEVYIFPYGTSYHSGECSSVKKVTVCMDREDAVKKGYTACSVCGG